tara:strand:+ start:607 stop:1383 length:777 start_codon:yes stop_codon:yes gene_type:complete
MAEALSMREEPKVELTPDEQESLAIGEELQAQQENLLAGKYKNAQELEKAYKELESKIGTQQAPDQISTDSLKSEETKEPEVKKEKTAVETAFLESLWGEAQQEGDFKQDTLDKLKGMNPTDLAQEYLNYRAANQSPTISQKDIDAIHSVAGGKEGYGQMMNWAKENLPKQEVQMFDTVIERGDPLACMYAVQSLSYKYNDAQGVEGRMLTGKAPKSSKPGYKSQAALVAAMNDPRYDNDPSYRQEVMDKLAQSDVEF